MSEMVLSQIENNISKLPVDEQLLLISRVADKLRRQAENEAEFEASLADMAADESIQSEMRSIEKDFTVTELDGLAG